MNESRARLILGDIIKNDNHLYDGSNFTQWTSGDEAIVLDGVFSAEYLEALVWWMRNK